jgi:Uma2 family endonuclease
MSTVAAKPQYTPEDLLTMPEGDRYELVNGELMERHMGWDSSWIGGRMYYFLFAFALAHRSGWVVPADASYQCFPDAPSLVRRPDVSFIRRGRLPGGRRPRGHCPVAPDLAVEVVSPNDLYSEVEEKVGEYRRAGVHLVWVIHPPTRTVRVHRLDGTITDLTEADELSGEDILPGFRCAVRELFADPVETVPEETANGQNG